MRINLDPILTDLKFLLRRISRHPVLPLVVIVSVGLAVGAAVCAFSLVDAAILRPLPVSDPDQLFYLTCPPFLGPQQANDRFPYPLFRTLREAKDSRVDLFADAPGRVLPVDFDGPQSAPDRVLAQSVSGEAFEVMGVHQALGRVLSREDDLTPGQGAVAVLSFDFWSRRMDGDPNVIGRWIRLGDQSLQIVGVAQKGFFGTEPGSNTDIWVPVMLTFRDATAANDAGWMWLRIWGRLRPGITRDDASGALQPVFREFRERTSRILPPELTDAYLKGQLEVRSAANGVSPVRHRLEPYLWVLTGVAGLVLALACGNAANLLAGDAARRAPERALKVALGAGRRRLLCEPFLESVFLSAGSCLLGYVFALRAEPFVIQMMGPSTFPVSLDISPDRRMAAFLIAICATVTTSFGLFPAIVASKVDPLGAIKSNAGAQSPRTGVSYLLVASESALCFLVLFFSGLFLLTFQRLALADLGFRPSNLAFALIELDRNPKGPAADRSREQGMWRDLAERVRALPGVDAVTSSVYAPLEVEPGTGKLSIEGLPDPARVSVLDVSPGFFETLSIPLSGRDFEEFKDEGVSPPRQAIVNRALADLYFGGQDPEGQQIKLQLGGSTFSPFQIIGIAGNAKSGNIKGPFPPMVYLPMGSSFVGDWRTLEIRTRLDPGAIERALQAVVPLVRPGLNASRIAMESQIIRDQMVTERLLGTLSAFFAFVAAAIALIGLYGVLSLTVVRRTKELGIRIALGSSRWSAIWWVIGRLLSSIAIGLLVGAIVGQALTHFISSLLYQQQPFSLFAMIAPICVIFLASALAATPFAVRIIKLEPVATLREE